MIALTAALAIASLVLAAPVIADDTNPGQPTGKRQHEPVSAAQPQPAEDEQQGTRVRKQMQQLKNNAQDLTPAMNKAELTETLSTRGAREKGSGMATGRRQHGVRAPDGDDEQAMNKAELIDAMASSAGTGKDEKDGVTDKSDDEK